MASLSLVELKKRNNLQVFLLKWQNQEDVVFLGGRVGKLPPYHEATAAILRRAVAGDQMAVKLLRSPEIRKILPLATIQKTAEFGSRGGGGGGGAGVANENFLVQMLREHMVTTPITMAFLAPGQEFLVKDVMGVDRAGGDTAGAKKSDVNLTLKNGKKIPLSLKQEDAGGWESSDRLFREAGTRLIDALVQKQQVQVKFRHGNQGDVFLNRIVAMEATEQEQLTTVFGSDIQAQKGAVIVRTFQQHDITYNTKKNRLEVHVKDIYRTLADIPPQKKPLWVIRNQAGRKSLPTYPGLRTEMKISKYAMTTEAKQGRELPLVVKLGQRGDYGLEQDILRT